MTIQLENFVIEQCEWNGRWTKFDLYRLHKRKEGKNVGQVVRKAELYHSTIEQCMDCIIQHRMSTIKEVDKDQFLLEYNKITDIIKEDVKIITSAFDNYVENKA